MSKEEVIIDILQSVGIYEKARKLVSSDTELARMFHQDFFELIAKIGG